MQGITPTGSKGSNLDVEALVDKLVKAEGAPTQNRLDRQEGEIQTHISALGIFRGALADFQDAVSGLRDAQDLRKVTATSSDEDKVAILAGRDAPDGVFQVEVQQLAQAQRLTTQAFASDLEPLGRGNLSFQFGKIDPQSGRFVPNEKARVSNIQITDDNNSLRGIQDAVNRADAGVRASLINDGQGHRLVFSAAQTGAINAMRIVVSDDDGNNLDRNGLSRFSHDPTQGNGAGMNLIETAMAQDAQVLLDGIEIRSPGNELKDAITGVTLDLKSTTEGQAVTLTTAFDVQGVSEAINNFVTAYNAMVETVNTVAGYDPETGEAGPLAGDAAVRGIAEQLRRTVGASYNAVNAEFGSLASIGIETQRNGTLSIDSSKVSGAVEQDLLQVAKLFARAGATSDPLIRYLQASEDAQMGAYEINISRHATQGRYIGADAGRNDNFRINADENSLTLRVDGVTSGQVRIAPGRYQGGSEMAEALQRAINNDEVFKREGVQIGVEYMLGQFVLTSARYGSSSRVDVLAAEDSLRDLGIDPAAGLAGENVQGSIGGQPAIGNGKILTGRGPASGIEIEVLGGKTGLRGEVTFSRGVAEQLSGMFAGFLGEQGMLTSRNKGYNNRIEDINRQREQLGRRLAVSEKRLMTQFSNLDAMMGKMNQTSAFLTNQLANLPGARSAKSGDGN